MIFVGTAIILIGGVMLATCSLIEIEPGKDSLVYRGSATKGVPKVRSISVLLLAIYPYPLSLVLYVNDSLFLDAKSLEFLNNINIFRSNRGE